MRISSSKIRVTECQITASWRLKDKPIIKNARFYYPKLHDDENTILQEIINNYLEIKAFYNDGVNGKLGVMIIVDGSRYIIRPLQMTSKSMILEQYFMHYDRKKQKVVPVMVRYDSIKFLPVR